jgi:hypothetical protein
MTAITELKEGSPEVLTQMEVEESPVPVKRSKSQAHVEAHSDEPNEQPRIKRSDVDEVTENRQPAKKKLRFGLKKFNTKAVTKTEKSIALRGLVMEAVFIAGNAFTYPGKGNAGKQEAVNVIVSCGGDKAGLAASLLAQRNNTDDGTIFTFLTREGISRLKSIPEKEREKISPGFSGAEPTIEFATFLSECKESDTKNIETYQQLQASTPDLEPPKLLLAEREIRDNEVLSITLFNMKGKTLETLSPGDVVVLSEFNMKLREGKGVDPSNTEPQVQAKVLRKAGKPLSSQRFKKRLLSLPSSNLIDMSLVNKDNCTFVGPLDLGLAQKGEAGAENFKPGAPMLNGYIVCAQESMEEDKGPELRVVYVQMWWSGIATTFHITSPAAWNSFAPMLQHTSVLYCIKEHVRKVTTLNPETKKEDSHYELERKPLVEIEGVLRENIPDEEVDKLDDIIVNDIAAVVPEFQELANLCLLIPVDIAVTMNQHSQPKYTKPLQFGDIEVSPIDAANFTNCFNKLPQKETSYKEECAVAAANQAPIGSMTIGGKTIDVFTAASRDQFECYAPPKGSTDEYYYGLCTGGINHLIVDGTNVEYVGKLRSAMEDLSEKMLAADDDSFPLEKIDEIIEIVEQKTDRIFKIDMEGLNKALSNEMAFFGPAGDKLSELWKVAMAYVTPMSAQENQKVDAIILIFKVRSESTSASAGAGAGGSSASP